MMKSVFGLCAFASRFSVPGTWKPPEFTLTKWMDLGSWRIWMRGSARSSSFAGLPGMRDACLGKVLLFSRHTSAAQPGERGQQSQALALFGTWGGWKNQIMKLVCLFGLQPPSSLSFIRAFDLRVEKGLTWPPTQFFGNRKTRRSIMGFLLASGGVSGWTSCFPAPMFLPHWRWPSGFCIWQSVPPRPSPSFRHEEQSPWACEQLIWLIENSALWKCFILSL